MTRRTVIRMGIGAAAAGMVGAEGLSAAPFSSPRMNISAQGLRKAGGRDILLLPGLASGPSIWLPLVQRMEGHRFHLVHIAGFAGKPAGANASGALLDPLAGELGRYIAQARLTAPVIIGHSMGGTLAIMLGLHPGVKIGRIMVIDMLPDASEMVGGTSEGMGYLAGQLNGYFTGTKAGRLLLARMVQRIPSARDSDPRVIAQSLTELARTDLTAKLPHLGHPLGVAYAVSADAEVADAQRRRYQQAYASAGAVSLAGIGPSGHMVMLDQPEKLARAVRTFIG